MKKFMAQPKRFRRIIQKFKQKRVLVVGDLMLDKYIWGNVSRISPEAPVPVVEVQRDSLCLGGAGNVAQNLLSLGAIPLLVGIVGDDAEGRWIRRHVRDNRGILVDRTRPTTVKTRIIAHHQQVVRVDWEKKSAVSAEQEAKILRFIQSQSFDGILISDYSKGMINASLLAKLLPYAKENGIPVFVDPKIEHFHPVSYTHLTLSTNREV